MKYFLICAPLCLAACTSTPELITIETEKSAPVLSDVRPLNQSPSLHLHDIAQRVAHNNPHIRAARLRINEAQGRVTQSGRLTNPSLGVGLNKTFPGSEAEMELSFSQQFPITNRLSLEKRISRKQLAIANEEVLAVQQGFSKKAQLTAIDILTNRQKQALFDEQLSTLQQLADFITDAAKKGELSVLDANQTNVAIATLKAAKERLKIEEQISISTLKTLIGLPHTASLKLNGSLPAVGAISKTFTPSNLPTYRAKLLEIEQAQQVVALEKARRYGDIETSAFTSLNRAEDAPEGLNNEGIVGVGVKIPLQIYDKNEGNIQQAQATAERLSREKSALALDLQQNANTHHTQLQSWLQQYNQVSNELIPLAQENTKQLDQAYRAGQSPFTSLLQARSQLLDLQAQKLEHLSSFHKARVRYFAATGNPDRSF